jgi:hypothetical protein
LAGDAKVTPNQCAYRAVQARRSLPHGQRPTDLHIRIVFLLARWQDASPAHAKLARAAHCHRNSVLNALHRLRDLGLLTWERQHIKLHGWRIQTTNRYLFVSNAALPTARPRLEQKGRKLSSLLGPQCLGSGPRAAALATMLAGAARLPDLLAARRAAWEAGQARA